MKLFETIFGGGEDTTPQPPNPYQVAASQGGANVQTATANSILNNANQVGPYGNINYSKTGTQQIMGVDGKPIDVPQFTATTTLNPAQQDILDKTNAVKSGTLGLIGNQVDRLGGVLGAPVDFSGLPKGGTLPTSGPQFNNITGGPTLSKLSNAGMPIQSKLQLNEVNPRVNLNEVNPNVNLTEASTTFRNVGGPDRSVGPQDWSADRLRTEQAIRARAAPQQAQQREQLAASLEAQGFRRGTAAFNNAMDEHNRRLNDFELATQQAGGAEQSRLAGLSFQQFDAENRAQQQEYQQAIQTGDFARASIAQNNLARLNEFGAKLQGTGFNNQARLGEFGAMLAGTQANNQARGQEGAFANAAQAQRFGQLAQTLGFNNNAAQQTWQNSNQRTQYGNDLAQRGFGNATTLSQMQDAQRVARMQEMLIPRNQAINEIGAIMSGNQVTMPNVQQYQGGRVNDTPLSQNVYASAAFDQQNAAREQQAQNAALGGLFGMIGTGIQGGMMYGMPGTGTNMFGMTRA